MKLWQSEGIANRPECEGEREVLDVSVHTWSAGQVAEGDSSGKGMRVALGNSDSLCEQCGPWQIFEEAWHDHLLKVMGSHVKVGLRSVADAEDLER